MANYRPVNYYSVLDGIREGEMYAQQKQRNALALQQQQNEIDQTPIRNRLAQLQVDRAQQESDQFDAQQAHARISQALNVPHTGEYLSRFDPEIAQDLFDEHGIDVRTADDATVKSILQQYQAHLAGNAGIAPVDPIQTQEIGGMNVLTQGGKYLTASKPQAPEGFTLNPGDVRYDANGKMVASAPAAPKAREAPSGYEWGSDGLRPIKGGPYDPANPRNERVDLKTQQALRKEFRSLPTVKDYETVLPIIKSAQKAPDTGPGDLQLIYAVGKILDPGSVVREGELQLAIKSGSLMEQLIGGTRLQLAGKGRIAPELRQKMLEMLNERVDATKQAYMRDYEQYSQYATEGGFDPASIVGTTMDSAFENPQGPVRVRSIQEAQRLPTGTVFITPDGRRKVR